MSGTGRRESYQWETYERKLKAVQYTSVFQRLAEDRGIGTPYYKLRDNVLSLDNVQWLLAGPFLAPPHGLDMLVPRPMPGFPKVPQNSSHVNSQVLAQRTLELKQQFQRQYDADMVALEALRRGCLD